MRGILLLAAMSAVVVSQAQTITIDFENYPNGPITNGFNGWQITNPGWDQGVQTAGAIAGNKSWRMSNAVASGSFGDQPYTPALPMLTGETQTNRLFTASFKWKALAGGRAGENVVVSIDNGTGQRGNYIRIQNVGGLDTSWRVDLFDYNGTGFVSQVLADNVVAGSVNEISFSMLFNPGLQNDVWTVALNGTPSYTGVGWEDFFIDNVASGPGPVNYDRLLFRAGGAPTSGAVGILFDDITYTSAVPEPATMTALGLGALALLRRKRKAA